MWGNSSKKKEKHLVRAVSFTIFAMPLPRKANILVNMKVFSLILAVKSGKCYNKQSLYSVYQYNNIFHILAKKQHRNKINNLSDSPLFTFHLVSSLALGRIQSAFQSSFLIIDLLSEECRSVFHWWIVTAKRKKTGCGLCLTSSLKLVFSAKVVASIKP